LIISDYIGFYTPECARQNNETQGCSIINERQPDSGKVRGESTKARLGMTEKEVALPAPD